MMIFVIPVKSQKVSTEWSEACRLFDLCLRSVCNQTSPDFRVLVICHERPQVTFFNPKVQYIEVDFPIPKPTYGSKNDDKTKKILLGLVAARELNPTHIMVVDADDRVSKYIAEFVSSNPTSNGWYVDKGYEYADGGQKLFVRRQGFYKICGTSNIINYNLLSIPDEVPSYSNIVADRFLTGHALAKGDLASMGYPISPLPFFGAIYVRDKVGESLTLQEPFIDKFRRNPRELFRSMKKSLLSPFNTQYITDSVAEEFCIFL